MENDNLKKNANYKIYTKRKSKFYVLNQKDSLPYKVLKIKNDCNHGVFVFKEKPKLYNSPEKGYKLTGIISHTKDSIDLSITDFFYENKNKIDFQDCSAPYYPDFGYKYAYYIPPNSEVILHGEYIFTNTKDKSYLKEHSKKKITFSIILFITKKFKKKSHTFENLKEDLNEKFTFLSEVSQVKFYIVDEVFINNQYNLLENIRQNNPEKKIEFSTSILNETKFKNNELKINFGKIKKYKVKYKTHY